MFPDRVIISDFNISIQKNEFVVITGASGAGKSTLLNIIGLLIHLIMVDIFSTELMYLV
ncbi:ATP-binding cassette domain-containing protein (plasmid) [Escherichia coli]|nr:ATP-binding cassette domain-containing protein [Escherichia coli]